MSWTKLIENKIFILFLWVLVCFALFINGVNSFISSSEFWSIFLSQKILLFESQWSSVYLKPFFHIILSVIYLLDLNDFYHIYAVKILFSINGVFQFFLIYKILLRFYKKEIVVFFLTLFLFCSPLFLSNYDRIRSDQLALTLFLAFILVSFGSNTHKKYLQQFLFPFVLSLIAFKHFYFSVLCCFFLPFNFYISYLNSLKKNTRILLFLTFCACFVWILKLSVPAAVYLISSFKNKPGNFSVLTFLAKTEWFYIYLSLFPYIFKEFRNYILEKKLLPVVYSQLLIIAIVLIHPQKFNFFIASFIPIFYLPSAIFIIFTLDHKIFNLKTIAPIIAALTFYSIYLAHKNMNVFSFNNPQLVTIERISNIITKNNLSYIDGMGILPRGKNLGCFASPDDDYSNNMCIQALINKQADAVIVTNRIMSLNFDFSSLIDLGYVGVGPNLFLKKELVYLTKNNVDDWPPPILIFTTEQLY